MARQTTAKKKSTFADILDSVAVEEKRRMETKVPSWASLPGLYFPTRLSTEQCSSEATALYKAGLIAGLGEPLEVADLTGGLGVDSWAFSKVAARVLHNEMDPELSEAVKSNFSLLGIGNVEHSTVEITPSNVSNVLSGFFRGKGVVFMDPARRSATGAKVFRLADCTPNVLELLPEIFSHVDHVLLKLSPMADIDLVVKEIDAASEGKCREVHVVASGGECKEILVLIDRQAHDGYTIICVEEDFRLAFSPAEEKGAEIVPIDTEDLCGRYLFEPGKSLTKAGAFKLPCSKFGLSKFGVSTHLYLADAPVEGIPGKWFMIEKAMDFDKAAIKAAAKEYPRCEVTSRNLPVTSDELRRRLGAKSGGSAHLFALHADLISRADHADHAAKNLLLVTTPYFRA